MPRIIQQIATLVGSAVVARGIAMVRGILLARILGPSGYGTLNGVLLVPNYAKHSHLGSLNAFGRNGPIAIGAGKPEAADEINASSFGFAMIAAVVVGIGVLFAAVVVPLEASLRFALLFVALLVVSQQFGTYILMLARVRLEFHRIAALRVLNVALQLGLAVGLGTLFGVVGAVAGIAVGQALTAFVGWFVVRPGVKPTFRAADCRPLLKLGLSLLWITALYTVIESVGRIMVLSWLGTEQLGYYAIALLSVSLLAFVPGAVGQVVSPRIMRAYGSGRTDRQDVLLREPIVMLGLLLPLMGGLGAVLAPLVVHHLLPEYADAILPAQILLVSYTPFAVRSFSGEVLIASAQISRVATLQMGGVAMAVGANAAALSLGMGITGVAIGTATVYWYFGVSMMISALRAQAAGAGAIAAFLLRSLAPTFGVGVVVLATDRLADRFGYPLTSPNGAIGATLILLVVSLPLIWIGWRRYVWLSSLKAQTA